MISVQLEVKRLEIETMFSNLNATNDWYENLEQYKKLNSVIWEYSAMTNLENCPSYSLFTIHSTHFEGFLKRMNAFYEQKLATTTVAPKDAQGYPLKPVQLCGLLEQEIFEDLPAVDECGQEAEPVQDAAQEQPSQQSSAGLPAGTGSAHSVAAPSGPVSVRGVLVPVVTEISLLARRPINLKLEAYP